MHITVYLETDTAIVLKITFWRHILSYTYLYIFIYQCYHVSGRHPDEAIREQMTEAHSILSSTMGIPGSTQDLH